MRAATARTMAALAVAALGGCVPERSQIVAVLHTDVPLDEQDAYHILVFGPRHVEGTDPADAETDRTFYLRDARAALPASFGIGPRDDDPDRNVRVLVEGLRVGPDADEPTGLRTSAITHFVPHEARRLDLFLAERCLDPEHPRYRTCGPTESCGRGGCVDEVIDPETLPLWTEAGAADPAWVVPIEALPGGSISTVAVAVDPTCGDVYGAAVFSGSVRMPLHAPVAAASEPDTLLFALSADGRVRWHRALGAASGEVDVRSVAIDGDRLLAGGYWRGPLADLELPDAERHFAVLEQDLAGEGPGLRVQAPIATGTAGDVFGEAGRRASAYDTGTSLELRWSGPDGACSEPGTVAPRAVAHAADGTIWVGGSYQGTLWGRTSAGAAGLLVGVDSACAPVRSFESFGAGAVVVDVALHEGTIAAISAMAGSSGLVVGGRDREGRARSLEGAVLAAIADGRDEIVTAGATVAGAPVLWEGTPLDVEATPGADVIALGVPWDDGAREASWVITVEGPGDDAATSVGFDPIVGTIVVGATTTLGVTLLGLELPAGAFVYSFPPPR